MDENEYMENWSRAGLPDPRELEVERTMLRLERLGLVVQVDNGWKLTERGRQVVGTENLPKGLVS